MELHREHAELTVVEGDVTHSFDVVHAKGREALSTLFRYDVLCHEVAGAPRPGKLLGLTTTLTLRDAFGGERLVHGIVAAAERTPFDDGTVHLRVVVRPRAYLLSLGSDCRAFQDETVVDVVRGVLNRAGIAARFVIHEPHATREFRAQYRESDASFIARLLEEDGAYSWFDHEPSESVWVVADRSPVAPDVEGRAAFELAHDVGLRSVRDVIEEIGEHVRASFGRASVASFDPGRPRLALRAGTASPDGSALFEHYDARGAGPRTQDEVARRSRVLVERAGVERALVSGRVSGVRLVPGRAFALADHVTMGVADDAEGRFEGRWLVVSSEIEVRQRTRDREGEHEDAPERRLSCRFEALPIDVPYRPAAATPRAQQPGLQSGVVVGAAGAEVHPDAGGRVRVQHHWDREGGRDDRSGTFMRVAQRGTAGSMLLPRVGWNVLTFNEEGSPDAPGILSRLHDVEHPPAYSLPDNKTRVVFKTATTPGGGSFNEVRYEDKKGGEEMFMNASRDMGVLVKNQKKELVARDSKRDVAVDHTLAVGGTHVETVANDQTITIGANERLQVAEARSVSVQGDLTQKVGASRDLHVGAAAQLSVKDARSLSVGAALLDITLGPIACGSGTTTSTMVGGAMIRATLKTLDESAKLGTVQTIGGAKIDLAKGNLAINAKMMHAETVGGLMMSKSADTWDEAALALTLTVAAAAKITAPRLTVVGDEQIVFKCGSSSLTITKDSIELKADAIKLDGKAIDADAPRIDNG